MSSSENKITTRLAANFAIGNKLEDGEILTADDFEEIYMLFGLAANTARASLPNQIKFGRFPRETGVEVRRLRFGRKIYYMRPEIKSDPGVIDRLRLLDEQYKSQREQTS